MSAATGAEARFHGDRLRGYAHALGRTIPCSTEVEPPVGVTTRQMWLWRAKAKALSYWDRAKTKVPISWGVR